MSQYWYTVSENDPYSLSRAIPLAVSVSKGKVLWTYINHRLKKAAELLHLSQFTDCVPLLYTE